MCAASKLELPPGSNSVAASKAFLPVILRTPLLIGLVTACIALLVVLEILSQKNAQDGGIIFAAYGQPLGSGQTFIYLYLPTIISVVGGMTWGWIELDVKRLEGFFQLSENGGTLGSEFVLLSYPMEFLPLVPPRAARRKLVGIAFTFDRANGVDNGPFLLQDLLCS